MANIFRKLKNSSPKKDSIDEHKKIEYKYSLDSPQVSILENQEVEVRGWLFSLSDVDCVRMRIKNNSKYIGLPFGLLRKDVAKAFPDINKYKTEKSGFCTSFIFEDGELILEADFGLGYQTFHKMDIKFSAEKLYESYFNPRLSVNTAEHKNLLENKHKYYFEESSQDDFTPTKQTARLVAFYLPQFHPIKENDEAWGKGFTEWTNVTSAQPRFVGHDQPILPADLGFYDLRVEENIKSQIKLAKKHGIHGFCYYYYWFSGKRLLQKPLDTLVKNKNWDFNFMLCWANENWTKRWDGRSQDIIISQKYLKDDPINFIKDVEDLLLDPRYIKQDGKPLLAVYRGTELENPERYTNIWRKYFMKQHGKDLELISMLNFDTKDPRKFGFDKGVEFAPLTDYRKDKFDKKSSRLNDTKYRLLDIEFTGQIADYRAFLKSEPEKESFSFPTYKSVAPSWDNEARKKGKGSLTLFGSNPDLYGYWLDKIIRAEMQKEKSPLVFINAWNEWAEGATLEPTKHFGHAMLNRTTQILSKNTPGLANNQSQFGIKRNKSTKLAVIIHVYYEEGWLYIKNELEKLDMIEYDLFITITKKNHELAKQIKKVFPSTNLTLVPNRGRDILPFLFLAQRLENTGYEYLLKLHTKRSNHRADGNIWFEELIKNLIPSKAVIKKAIEKLEKGIPLIGPANHYISLREYLGNNNKHITAYLEKIYNQEQAKQILIDSLQKGFFSGSMFWCRVDSLKPLFEIYPIPEDFESEKGQIDGTLAHAIERLFTILVLAQDKDIYKISIDGVNRVEASDPISNYKYAR